jgi:hypothetical protein
MAAYVIVETDVTDPEQYEQCKAASPAAIAAGGGRFLVRVSRVIGDASTVESGRRSEGWPRPSAGASAVRYCPRPALFAGETM